MTSDSAEKRAWQLINDISFCMLVSRSGDRLTSRPMSHIAKGEEGRIYILTSTSTDVYDGIRQHSEVLLTLTDGSSKFVSLSAEASLDDNRGLINRLWNPGAQAFWPEGPDDRDVVAIVLAPGDCEYWDGPGSVISAVKLATAIATGTTPDFGENAKVALNSMR